MGIEHLYGRQHREQLADTIAADLDRIHARLGMERLRLIECELQCDDEGICACLDEIADLERDEARLLREMPEEGQY